MTRLHVARWGNAGPLLCLVHGSIFAGEATWGAQRPLADRFRVLLPDRRGFGESAPAEREDFLVDTGDLLAVLEEPAHLVGHSYGGIVIMLAAAQRRDLVKSLTVIEAPIYHIAAHVPEVAAALDRSKERDAAERDPQALLLRSIGPPRQGGYSPELLRGAKLMINQRRPWEATIPFEALAGIPALIVSGGHSPIHEATCGVLASRLGAERAVICGRGHAVQRTGEEFNRTLEEFVLRAEGASA